MREKARQAEIKTWKDKMCLRLTVCGKMCQAMHLGGEIRYWRQVSLYADNVAWAKGVSQETRISCLLCCLRDVGQEQQEQVQVIWLGTERRVTWQEAQIMAETSGRRRKVLEDSSKSRDTWDHVEPGYNDCPCKLAEGEDHWGQSLGPVTLWPGLAAARLVTARVMVEGLNKDPWQH